VHRAINGVDLRGATWAISPSGCALQTAQLRGHDHHALKDGLADDACAMSSSVSSAESEQPGRPLEAALEARHTTARPVSTTFWLAVLERVALGADSSSARGLVDRACERLPQRECTVVLTYSGWMDLGS